MRNNSASLCSETQSCSCHVGSAAVSTVSEEIQDDAAEREARLDKTPDAMRTRRETVEHPFGTLKMRMGATHFLMKTLPKVATEMALHALAYDLTRLINIVGIKPLLAAIRA
jgi:Transposase DDE domain